MKDYKILWKNEEIGHLINPMSDMWYLDGIYQPNSTDLAKQFADLAVKFEIRIVLADPTKGIRAKLQIDENEFVHILVMELGENNELFVRQILGEEGIAWLIEHVPEGK